MTEFNRVFELSSYRGEYCVIMQDLDNLELQIIFQGTLHECESLIEKLTDCYNMGFFDQFKKEVHS